MAEIAGTGSERERGEIWRQTERENNVETTEIERGKIGETARERRDVVRQQRENAERSSDRWGVMNDRQGQPSDTYSA